MGIGTITDSNAMFCYFEMIEKLGAKSVLDAGMFLKRIGAISRQMAGVSVSADTILCGIDFYEEIHLPIFRDIYDEIKTWNDFADCLESGAECFTCMESRKFDLAVMLYGNQVLNDSEKVRIIEYFMQKANGILTDEPVGNWMRDREMIKGFYPIYIESSIYAWIPVHELKVESCSN